MSGEHAERLDRLDRLETTLGHLLRTGVMSAAACLTTGLIVWMIAGGTPFANGILTVGLVILMVTPLMRVVVSLVAYTRMRDWFFVTTTVLVFVMLLVAWLLKP
jgi:uncharacterized membrane protein